ncbi:DNA-primase RepB domain-containing protein [Klebsiella pneumoniae]|uniref:DNA-primase RepB domain-containing protein n=1 Tax=Klebsiella pneumoniae TaxID=573 RepID=UPI003A5CFA63
MLVDDLSEFDLDDMKAEGREPALIVETSPKNYQAWVKVAQDAPAGHRGVIARKLAREYDADPASADSRHYGRLAGFTNRKDKHTTRTGYQPWVLLRESKGKTATAGPELMQQAGQVLDSIKRQQERTARLAEITARGVCAGIAAAPWTTTAAKWPGWSNASVTTSASATSLRP